jgi:hypothetical protein
MMPPGTRGISGHHCRTIRQWPPGIGKIVIKNKGGAIADAEKKGKEEPARNGPPPGGAQAPRQHNRAMPKARATP